MIEYNNRFVSKIKERFYYIKGEKMNIFATILWYCWCLLTGTLAGEFVKSKRGKFIHYIIAIFILIPINLGILYLIKTYLV